MSREFGSYTSGYFHYQMEVAAEDCKQGDYELTKLWGEFLAEFYDVAYAIASVEAGDSSPEDSILTTMRKMEGLQARLNDIKEYLKPFDRVAQVAVREALKKANKND